MAIKEKTIKIPDAPDNVLEFRIRQMSASTQAEFTVDAGALFAPILGASFGETDGGLDAVFAAFQKKGLGSLGGIDVQEAKKLADFLLKTCCAKVCRDEKTGVIDAYLPCGLLDKSMDGYTQDFRTIYKLIVEAVKINYSFLSGGGEGK